ncbi:hypothetical protein CABS01_00043 [Colletotrichum abscissum]|uniref:Phosphatidylcholine-sterol O-acyltransferase-like protein n=1 Tax=Colletotrichum abscissum TaxID=1671311 RepID=A0A9Q0B3D6_9PEZI|nr:uncharacterized protein CABS01_00043 [Colletotrichum abscissum]KAI3549475.1 hypothetical protein CABS02_07939 [Colletotrichum abscissum]KAK1524954.1 hypothetical protein CABS01_00043 [Colletotrichum abscissum]
MVAMSQKEGVSERRRSPSPILEKVPSEDPVYGDDDQDGAQSVMQPALSVAATRLTLPQTSKAEKAAALERERERKSSGLFLPGNTSSDDSASSPELTPFPDEIPTTFETESDTPISPAPPRRRESQKLQKARPAPKEDLPSPWQSSPRNMIFGGGDGEAPKTALESISFGQTRHKRSSSTGADALKKFSNAFSSFPAPSAIFNSLSFFTAAAEKTEPKSTTTTTTTEQRKFPLAQSRRPYNSTAAMSSGANGLPRAQTMANEASGNRPSVSSGRPSTTRPRVLRRVTSDDSLLYHSLSRTSSIGDDDGRFDHVREMANVRMKAIKDSLPERPTFKMPSLPKLGSSLKLNEDATGKTIPEAPAPKVDNDGLSTLDRVLETLTGDIVILGGYRGSILRSAEPPHHQLWAPVKIGLNMRKADLEVGLDPEDEESMEERIIPSGMLQNIGPIDISRKLFKKIAACENVRKGKLRLHDYGYDWRLSPHLLSRKMVEFLEKLPCNQADSKEPRGALVLAHSLGGLITRHVVNQRPDLFSGVVYVGTPQRCINVLGPLRDGDAVLLNEKILTAQVNFSLRTSFVFLPDDGFCFVNKDTKEEYNIDFHDVNEWIKYRLTPCIEPPLPSLAPKEKSTTFSSLLSVRSRSSSEKKQNHVLPPSVTDAARRVEHVREGGINPQIDGNKPSPFTKGASGITTPPNRARNIAYLERTLAEVKRFRQETQFDPALSEANAYPPLGIIYGKEVPTVYAVKVSSREAICHAQAYDDLIFRAGDGVVLAREAQLPEGYELVRGGRVSTERGHLTMLGDMPAVGKALEAVIRGRRKGIGMGKVVKEHVSKKGGVARA